MSDRPTVTPQQIHARASEQSFSRGENYYHTGAVTDTVRRGDEIEARCQGSYPEPYRVWAQLDESGITATRCNCDYDWGGDCKHIVALLLTYLYQPDQFEARQTLQEALLNRSKEDLVDIIEQMIAVYPDLQDIVDRPTPTTVINQHEATIDTQVFRRELRQSLGFSGQWMDRTAENKVYEIANAGERFARRGDYTNAIAIYCTILKECNASEYPTDDEGDYVVSINHTVGLLRDALGQVDLNANDDLRQRVLDALVGAFIWDVDFGGIGYGDEATDIILEIVRPEDVARLRDPIMAAQKRRSQDRYGSWGVEAYERFLIELDAFDTVDPQETLNRLQSQGLHFLAASKLLDLKRYDEVVATIRDNLPASYEFQRGLDLLVSHQQIAQAIRLAEDALGKEYDNRLIGWLIQLYQKQQDREAEFQWQLKRMQAEPSINHYIGLKGASVAIGCWQSLQPQILDQLGEKQAYDVLTLAYLHDEEWDRAWDTLSLATVPQHHHPSWAIYRLDFTVAEKSRHVRPKRAIPVYVKYARAEINIRNRKHYAHAAELLSEVRKLYHQTDDRTGWDTFIAGIREEFKRLPAFQDELNKVGL